MAARKVKIRHDEETRAKIQASQIINRFYACVMGEVELDAQQVSCGKALLAKILPDLSAVDHSGQVEHVNASDMSDDEIVRILRARTSNGTAAPQTNPAKLN